ncbi:glycosyltransferase family 4 protein [Thalassospira sp.]|uniref:glycosyltransferase family 4 protein n=1 Tax=Thalassospira sp. TaxID=1912094 RepID=UPI000C4A93CD|nr:glycosyltransferase family 4 protein [Thalassospira sp.]MBC07612.1 glycosyltransferase family 1 protein [Thalassospira sp.]|tara:strand:- start:16855 stop:17982 length:1128 start_codon:yes stop_codon:yes gene_type:complete
MGKRLLYVVNVDWFFLSHRLPLAIAAQKQGFEVHVAVSITDGMKSLEECGFTVHKISISRGKSNLLKEIKAFIQVFKVFFNVKADVVHLVTIKPVIYGGIAARILGVRRLVAAISGLGHTFVAKGIKASLLRSVVAVAYRIALSHRNQTVIFQNSTDLDCLTRLAGLSTKDTKIIKGSGVDLRSYEMSDLPGGMPRVVMACRLLSDKGVWQFVEAARILKVRGVRARFELVGDIDPGNPTSLSLEDLQDIDREGIVERLGYRSDIVNVMKEATIVTLPSFYGEGLPKVLIEAAASGRPIVTTDMPGCRDAVKDGVTGVIIPPRDSISLADALQNLLENPALCISMGRAGREKAEKEFDIDKIVQEHIDIYQSGNK